MIKISFFDPVEAQPNFEVNTYDVRPQGSTEDLPQV